MRLYIGNLPYQATEADLENWFGQAGITVDSVSLMRDRFSGEARGFGFVDISNEQDGQRAVSTLNGKDFLGRTLVVNEARPLTQAAGRSSGGPRPSGGGGGRGGRTRY